MAKANLTVSNFLTPPSTEVSRFLAADDQLVVCNGVNPAFKLGELRKDLGYSILGQVISSYGLKVTGLYDFRQSSSVQEELALAVSHDGLDALLFYRTTGAFMNISAADWLGIIGAGTGYDLSADSFMGYAWMVGYDRTSQKFLPPATLTGTTFTTTGQTNLMPWGKYVKKYRDRIYVANCYIYDYFTKTGGVTNVGSAVVTMANTNHLYVGIAVAGTNIALGSTVLSVDSSTQVTLSLVATGTGTGLSFDFGTNVQQYYPHRIYFSSVPTSGLVTWSKFLDYLDVDFSEEITGLATAFDAIFSFTAYDAYLYDQSTWKNQRWPGCANHYSIQSSETYLIYANSDGIWLSTGGRPTCISTSVTQLIRNSDSTKWSSAIVSRVYSLYLGNTSANGISYQNCLLNVDLSSGMIWWRELRGTDNDSMVLVAVRRSGEEYLHFSSQLNPLTLGNVYVKSRYKDASPKYFDNADPIYAQFRTKAYDMSDPTVKKTITSIIAYCERGSGLKLFFRTMDTNQKELTDWTEIGYLDRVVKKFDNQQITGYFIEFKGEEYSTSPYFQFLGFSALLAQSTHHD